MFILNDQENLHLILSEFSNFLTEKSGVSFEVKKRYFADINYYFSNILLRKDKVMNFSSFFESDSISNFYGDRTGDTASASVHQLLSYMVESTRIDKEQALIIRENISTLKPMRPQTSLDFLIEQERIKFLFSEKVKFVFIKQRKMDYSNYKLLAPLVWSLAFDCGMEQKHAMNLLESDFDRTNYRIRNLRRDKNETLSEWIDLKARTFDLLEKYLVSRDRIITGNLLVIGSRPISSEDINTTYRILQRKENSNVLNQTISSELLVRSGILKSLEETNGQSLLMHTLIHGTESNSQLVHATKKYMENRSEKSVLS
ncbi:hypothetical protein D3C75_241850 [compost metagenome]